MRTLLEQAKHTIVFTKTMFVGSLAHTRAPRNSFFLSQNQNMFFEFGQSLSLLNIRTDSFDMKFALTVPISSARVPVRFKFMFTLLREAWRNVADFLASRPVDINFLQAQWDDEIGQKYEGLAPERCHPIVEVIRT